MSPTPHPWPNCTPLVNLGKKKKVCKERKRDFASLHLHNMKEDARMACDALYYTTSWYDHLQPTP